MKDDDQDTLSLELIDKAVEREKRMDPREPIITGANGKRYYLVKVPQSNERTPEGEPSSLEGREEAWVAVAIGEE